MKKRFQLIALLAVALLGACSGGKDKVAVEQVDEKPRVKLADVKARPVEQIHEYTATVEAEVKNNIAPSSPVRIDRILVEVGDRVSKGQKLVSKVLVTILSNNAPMWTKEKNSRVSSIP